MSVGSNVIKITAKTALQGNYLKAFFSSSILLFCILINYYLSSLVSVFADVFFADAFQVLFSAFINFPLFLGIIRFFWRMLLGCSDNPIAVFYYFSSGKLYFKTVKLLFALVYKLLPISILVSLPAIFLWLLSQTYMFEFFGLAIPLWTRNLEFAILFAKTFSLSIIIVISLRYYISYVLFVSNDDIDVMEAIYMSSVISKKSSLDFIYLIFSFIIWIILSVFVFPLVFIIPYFITSYLVHSRFVIAEYNNHIENLKTAQYPSFSVGV